MNKSKLKIVHQFSLLAIVALLVIVGLALLDFHHKSTIDNIIQQEEQLLSLRKQLTDIEREVLRARLEEFQMIASRKSSFFEHFEKK
jgi:peptidoglycan hydrolase CwlO-like protein